MRKISPTKASFRLASVHPNSCITGDVLNTSLDNINLQFGVSMHNLLMTFSQVLCSVCKQARPFLKITPFVFAFTNSDAVHGQDTLQGGRTITYEIKLKLRNNQKKEGYLKDITDSTVVYSTAKSTIGAPYLATDKYVGYSDIELVRIRRKGSVGRGALIGLGAGAATGALAGFASGDDPPSTGFFSLQFTAGEKAGALAILFGLPGAALGAILGTTSLKFPVNGTKEGLIKMRQAMQEKLKAYSVPVLE
jgi:hypothetical protein